MPFEYIVCDPDKCTGCQECELACSVTKHGAFNPLLARIRNVRIEPVVTLSVSCKMCEEPPCVISCPRKALSQDPKTGVIMVNNELCDGCGWCIEACDFGAILLNPASKRVEICDLCADQDEPQCVRFCGKDALYLATPEVVAQKARREAVTRLLQELVDS